MSCSIPKSWARPGGTICLVLSSQASMLGASCISVVCEWFPTPRSACIIIQVEGGETYARNNSRTAEIHRRAEDSCRALPQTLHVWEIRSGKFRNQGRTSGGFVMNDELGFMAIVPHFFHDQFERFERGVYNQNRETFKGNITEFGCRRPASLRSN